MKKLHQIKSNIFADEVGEELLTFKTNRFLNAVLEDNFWDWMSNHYFNDKDEIFEDLASFDDINESEKILEILSEMSYILKSMKVKNRAELNLHLQEVKYEFGYNKVYVLKTVVKLLVRLLDIDMSDFEISDKE